MKLEDERADDELNAAQLAMCFRRDLKVSLRLVARAQALAWHSLSAAEKTAYMRQAAQEQKS